ncbi:MAG: DUF4743 domain-containing protein [Rhodospirillales bacterium]|nr:MAG: DUF4743 domain-containing protein [Rhodospirillales bacterium]
MSYLDRIRACQVFDPAAYRPFRVDGANVGWVRPGLAAALADHPAVFAVSDDALVLHPRLQGFGERTTAVAEVVQALNAQGVLDDWRGEMFAAGARFDQPLFAIDRGAVPAFGIRGYGVHLNGFVCDDPTSRESMRMWVGRRSLTKRLSPGKLDQLVAGGQPAGLSLRDNLEKEAAEEAAIPRALVSRARPVGAISYRTEQPEGLRNDVLLVYDLALPPGFVPRNTDGELSGFELWPIDRVAAAVRDGDAFKFNCALVVIDFLIRHGFIGPEEPDYLALVAGLHVPE